MALSWLNIVLIAITFLAIAGNSLVIVAVWRKQYLRTTPNFLLVHLATSDITSLLFLLVRCIEFAVKLEKGVLADSLCKLFLSYNISAVASCVSVVTLIVLAVERYHAVVSPFHSGSRLKDHTLRIVLASIWLTSLALSSPLFIFTTFDEEDQDCRLDYDAHKAFFKVYKLFGMVVLVFLPLAIIAFCYFRIARSLYLQNKVAALATSPESQRARFRRQAHVVKMSVTVTVLFAICLLPLATIVLVNFVTGSTHKISMHFYIMFFGESGVNPFIYAFQSTSFRNAFKDILKCSR